MISIKQLLMLAVGYILWPSTALAADICSEALICASRPAEIVQALQIFGHQAELKKDSNDDPLIESEADGYKYSIYFYDCEENANCTSVQFRAWFDKEEIYSAKFANEWNLSKRFAQMAFDPKDGTVMINHDLSTVGGLTRPNFGDTVEWWVSILGEFNKFYDARTAAKKQNKRAD